MKKSTKRFVITSEEVNSFGFRVRTSGIELTQYEKNPLLLWMHKRPKGLSKDEILPLGNMLDIEVKDNKIYGTPSFDDTDEFAVTIYNKVENGTIRMASAGLFPLKWENIDNEIWLVKSILVENSIADIGSNNEALGVMLYDENDKLITLSTLTETFENLNPKIDMKLIQLGAATLLPLLKLAEGATPEDVEGAIGKLVTLADSQAGELVTLKADKDAAITKLADLNKQINADKIVALVDAAVTARKIVAGDKDNYIKLATAAFDTTEALLDGMKAAPTVNSQLKDDDKTKAYEKLSWKELDAQGKLIQLKADNIDLFKSKFKTEFGSDYKA